MIFSNQASSEDVAVFVLLLLFALRHHLWPLGDEREHLIVVALMIPESVTRLSLDFEVVSSAEQKMDLL